MVDIQAQDEPTKLTFSKDCSLEALLDLGNPIRGQGDGVQDKP